MVRECSSTGAIATRGSDPKSEEDSSRSKQTRSSRPHFGARGNQMRLVCQYNAVIRHLGTSLQARQGTLVGGGEVVNVSRSKVALSVVDRLVPGPPPEIFIVGMMVSRGSA